MKYSKPALTIADQVALLQGRGMIGDPDTMRHALTNVGYYRLSGYWFPFRVPDEDTFRPGTSFDVVWERYVFDRKLRLLVMDAVERVEIAVRAFVAYEHSHAYGPFGYVEEPSAFPKLEGHKRAEFRARIDEEVRRAHKETFVKHFKAKYGDTHAALPLWVATEVMTFGTIQKLFESSPHPVKRRVADHLGVAPAVLESWLLALNVIRNVCAHHSRLWNRVLGVKPMIPRDSAAWHRPVAIGNERIFGILTILTHGLDHIAKDASWGSRVRELVEEHPKIPMRDMGFPADWLASPIWKGAARNAK